MNKELKIAYPITLAVKSTSRDIKTVFHARPSGRFTETKHFFRRNTVSKEPRLQFCWRQLK